MTKTEILNYSAVEPYIVYNKVSKIYGIVIMKENDGDHIIIINANSQLKSWLEASTLRASFFKISDEDIKKVNSNLLEIIKELSESTILKNNTEETKKLIELIIERNNKLNEKKEKISNHNNDVKKEKDIIIFRFVYNFNGYEETIERVTFSIDKENNTVKIYKNNRLERIISSNIEWHAYPLFDEDEEDIIEDEEDVIEDE